MMILIINNNKNNKFKELFHYNFIKKYNKLKNNIINKLKNIYNKKHNINPKFPNLINFNYVYNVINKKLHP
jgi:hypothetical protein